MNGHLIVATVFSKQAQDNLLGQSLFERLYQKFNFDDSAIPIKMLYIQYRMHPDICQFPSKQFYKGKLKTDKYIRDTILLIDAQL
jgi:superfamily I DNA and/or RNA helicase